MECGKTTMNQKLGNLSFNLFCITFSLFEHLELLELRTTSTAGKTMLFCAEENVVLFYSAYLA